MTVGIPNSDSGIEKDNALVGPLAELCIMIKGSTMLKAGRMVQIFLNYCFHFYFLIKKIVWTFFPSCF